MRLGLVAAAMIWVAAELPASAQPDVAGHFYLGDGTGLNWDLSLRQNHTFSFVWRGCLGEYGKSSGRWQIDADRLHLLPDGAVTGMADRVPLEYRAVTWGERLYLVAETEIIDFCNSIKDGGEPRASSWGLVFLREGDWHKTAPGRPRLDPSWRSFLLDRPARARVVAVDRGAVHLGAGADAGLKPGMTLFRQADRFASLRIVSVAGSSSVARIEFGQVEVGDWTSSQMYDQALWTPAKGKGTQ
jgi:hypothetical protein